MRDTHDPLAATRPHAGDAQAPGQSACPTRAHDRRGRPRRLAGHGDQRRGATARVHQPSRGRTRRRDAHAGRPTLRASRSMQPTRGEQRSRPRRLRRRPVPQLATRYVE